MQVNVHEAKSSLSRLLVAVEAGEDVVIARDGKPVARLVPVAQPVVDRSPGWFTGKIVIGDDFDDPLDEEFERAFRGESPDP